MLNFLQALYAFAATTSLFVYMVPKGSGKGQNCALVCGSQMEQEGRSRMVEMLLVLVEFWPGPGSSVSRAPAASAGVPGSIPGWDVLAFFPSCLTSSFKIFLSF